MSASATEEPLKCFIINGILPSPYASLREEEEFKANLGEIVFSSLPNETCEQREARYREAGLEAPSLGDKVLLRFDEIGSLSVLVFGIYEALFLIRADSQRGAYLIANALRSFLFVVDGIAVQDDRSNYYLLELESPPRADMALSDIVALVKPVPDSQTLHEDGLSRELASGPVIPRDRIREICDLLSIALERPETLRALKHLEYSHSLFWGYMTGSYYALHYFSERTQSSGYDLEKLYLEHSVRFDLAFLSAFRGLESLLAMPYLQKHDILSRLAALDSEIGTSFCTDTYECFHLSFSGGARFWKYADLIDYFLVLRNSVAAHANPGAPYIIMEDQVYEIQRLVVSMLSQVLAAAEPTTKGQIFP